MASNKERIKEVLFREALCAGRVQACEECNDYFLKEQLAASRRGRVCKHCGR